MRVDIVPYRAYINTYITILTHIVECIIFSSPVCPIILSANPYDIRYIR